MWSAQLHFAWDVVLARLYELANHSQNGEDNHKTNKKDHKVIDLAEFWTKAVEGELILNCSNLYHTLTMNRKPLRTYK